MGKIALLYKIVAPRPQGVRESHSRRSTRREATPLTMFLRCARWLVGTPRATVEWTKYAPADAATSGVEPMGGPVMSTIFN